MMSVNCAGISAALLAWYARHGRVLPWRGETDAYKIWVSEIMLQQTRVETVIPYYTRWLERFPTLAALASASQQEVLQAWEGLGYYSRGRNLHRAAGEVMVKHGGNLPASLEELRRLPGIGEYTAAAIASIAFGRDAAALDGNIRRVLARLFDLQSALKSPEFEQQVRELAQALLPPGRAGDYNQALMDLGATLCTPRTPGCARCPLMDFCLARQRGVQEQRPVREKHPPVPLYTVTAAIIRRDGRLLLARRPQQGLLGGLWEFPGGKVEEEESLPACLQRELREELGVEVTVGEELGIFRHAYTHYRVRLHAFSCTLVSGEPQPIQPSALAWVSPQELDSYPMGKIDRQIARLLQQAEKESG